MEKRQLILRNFLSPGDLVLLTAAVRDLHRCHPGRFITDVRSSCPELWEHNPYLTPLRDTDRGVETIDCHYPLIHRANEAPYHCIHGFADFLGSQLGLSIRPTLFAGDIHLSRDEARWKSTVHELSGRDLPFWIINAGGKFDYTIKWWDWRRYQQVVDHFRKRILFVQIGEIGHYHPPLQHVVDLRGRTDLRQLIRLVHHAQGVLCGVTALMHLAPAVPTRPDRPRARAAVIVAGGREPTHWAAYPQHQFIHTIGALPCCATGGCWRSRVRPIGDGEQHDAPTHLCSNVFAGLPRCMEMISADAVIDRIASYFTGGANRFLTRTEAQAAERAVNRSLQGARHDTAVNLLTAPHALDQAAREKRQEKPPAMDGRGVLLFASTRDEINKALTSARRVRAVDFNISMECWMGVACPRSALAGFQKLRVSVRPALAQSRTDTLPLTFSEMRLHALTNSNLREVLVLDPGTQLHVPPETLFRQRAYRETGVLFGRAGKFGGRAGVWKLARLRVPRFTADSTCFVLDRARCWRALSLWSWISHRAYFFSGYVDGQAGAAQLALARLGWRLPLTLPASAFSAAI